ncbi:MAG: cell division protein FtsQ [Thermodesulfobacteriota bacterium]|nr:cell division protein FtsQ [Thermodesulfobacteriota bacterium]
MEKGNKRMGAAWGRIGSLLGVIASGISKVSLFLVVITGVSLCFLSLYHYLLTSPYMRLEQVDINGVDPRMREELIRMYGLHDGQGLLSLHLDELKRKMEAHPWIRTVKLERRFPHTLVVEVEKQVAAALVRMDDFYYVNRWGEIFKPVSGNDDVDLPLITGLSADNLQVQEELRRAIHVVKVLEPEEGPWSVSELSEIHLRKDGAMSLYFNHVKAEITFMWNELADKMDGLRKVAEHLNQSGKSDLVTRINLNYVDGAVVSFSSS